MSNAEEHLHALVDLQLESLPRDGQIHQMEGAHALQVVDAGGSALASVKAIDEWMARRILYDFRDTLVSLGLVDQKTLLGGPLGYQEPAGPRSWENAPRRSAPHLLRVIPVAKDLGPVPGAKSAVLVSTEIWSDHVGMRFVLFRPDEDGVDSPNWAWRLRDDLGTVYRIGAGSSGGGTVWKAEYEFHPAPPREATKLIILAHRIGDSPHPEPPGAMWRASGPIEEELFSVEISLSEEQPPV